MAFLSQCGGTVVIPSYSKKNKTMLCVGAVVNIAALWGNTHPVYSRIAGTQFNLAGSSWPLVRIDPCKAIWCLLLVSAYRQPCVGCVSPNTDPLACVILITWGGKSCNKLRNLTHLLCLGFRSVSDSPPPPVLAILMLASRQALLHPARAAERLWPSDLHDWWWLSLVSVWGKNRSSSSSHTDWNHQESLAMSKSLHSPPGCHLITVQIPRNEYMKDKGMLWFCVNTYVLTV